MKHFSTALFVVSIANGLLLNSAAAPIVSNSAAGPSKLSTGPSTSSNPPPVRSSKWMTPSQDRQATANGLYDQGEADRPPSPFDPNDYTPASSPTDSNPDFAVPPGARNPRRIRFSNYLSRIGQLWPFRKIRRSHDPYRNHTPEQKRYLKKFRNKKTLFFPIYRPYSIPTLVEHAQEDLDERHRQVEWT